MYQTELRATLEMHSVNGSSSVVGGHLDKGANLKEVYKQLFLKGKDSSYVKCRYRIIGRLIFIKVLWELSYLNTPIKGKL